MFGPEIVLFVSASDVPIAAFLSGGIDSSLVLSYAVEQSAKPISAFTIGFREERYDESPFARRVAEVLGVRLRVGSGLLVRQ